jgi:hypothetical protein
MCIFNVYISVVQVRFARSHQYVPAGQGPMDNRQLFFTRAPVVTTEEELQALFSSFGEVGLLCYYCLAIVLLLCYYCVILCYIVFEMPAMCYNVVL